LVILLPLMAWVAVLGFIWRCSNADDPRASFRNWRPAILLVACIAALLSFLAWRKTVREELGHKTRIVRVETRALESAALMYYYEESEAWLVGGNREVIEKLTKLRENGSPAYMPYGTKLRLAPDGSAIDPWDRPYLLEVTEGKGMKVWSAGPDGERDTKDDLQRDRDH
jgi:hypothetical protein